MNAAPHCPERIDEVAEWLRDGAAAGRRVRLVGGGSRQHERAPIADGVARLDLSRLDRIVRLDPGDQTCTVECGLSRAHLDEALAEHELELPCLGDGTIGGLFAADPFGPAGAPPAQSPRSLLLGPRSVVNAAIGGVVAELTEDVYAVSSCGFALGQMGCAFCRLRVVLLLVAAMV